MKLSDLYDTEERSKEYYKIYARDWRSGYSWRIARAIKGKPNLVNVDEKDLFTKRDLEYLSSINGCFLFDEK